MVNCRTILCNYYTFLYNTETIKIICQLDYYIKIIHDNEVKIIAYKKVY
jgi:hypothetical protein